CKPTLICTIAQRTSLANIFAEIPQQSDYVAMWHQKGQTPTSTKNPSTLNSVRKIIPAWIKNTLRPIKNAISRPSPFDRPYYRFVADDDLVSGRFLDRIYDKDLR